MAKKKLSRDQKRKQKLEKRSRPGGAAQQQTVAERFTHDTERVIHESFLAYGRDMRDADVRDALKQLVVDVQQGKISKENASAEIPDAKGVLIWNIKQHWSETRTLASIKSLLAAQALMALAQHIESIEAPGASQSYLRFLEGSQDGVRALATEHAPAGVPRPGDWSADESPLLDLGLAWLRASSETTWDPFHAEATRMIEAGQAQAAANVCQYLYGTMQAEPVELALRPLLDTAHEKLGGHQHERAASEATQPTA
jgi:hypothetical protein